MNNLKQMLEKQIERISLQAGELNSEISTFVFLNEVEMPEILKKALQEEEANKNLD